jgi:hypothetical protein
MDITVEVLGRSNDEDLLHGYAAIQGATTDLQVLANAARLRLRELAQLKHEAAGNAVAAARDEHEAQHEAARINAHKLAMVHNALRTIDMTDGVMRDEVNRWFQDVSGCIVVHRDKLTEFARRHLESDGGFKVVEKVRPPR